MCRLGRLRVGVAVVALAAAAMAADPASAPPTAADIKWPKPSQKPGTVKFVSRYPTEDAWDPALDRFRKDVGQAEFARRLAVAAEFAAKRTALPAFRTGAPATAAVPAPGAAAAAAPAAADLLRAIDIVRIPLLTGEELDAALTKLTGQLRALEADGYGTAVWEITDLPAPGKGLQEWSAKGLAAFPRPPILMLGWRVAKGKLQPKPDAMDAFLRLTAGRCHSLMLTGEEFNTQYYGEADGGRALDFQAWWLGFVREVSPDTFVWARIDEVVYRPNNRNQAWVTRLCPLVDGIAYQAGHDALMPDYGIGIQVGQLRRNIARAQAPATGAAKTAPPAVPLLVGGFREVRETDPDEPLPESVRAQSPGAEIPGYEQWLRDHQVCGYIRFVGYPPKQPYAYLLSRPLAAGPATEEKPK